MSDRIILSRVLDLTRALTLHSCNDLPVACVPKKEKKDIFSFPSFLGHSLDKFLIIHPSFIIYTKCTYIYIYIVSVCACVCSCTTRMYGGPKGLHVSPRTFVQGTGTDIDI